jgi:hypothetical protein
VEFPISSFLLPASLMTTEVLFHIVRYPGIKKLFTKIIKTFVNQPRSSSCPYRYPGIKNSLKRSSINRFPSLSRCQTSAVSSLPAVAAGVCSGGGLAVSSVPVASADVCAGGDLAVSSVPVVAAGICAGGDLVVPSVPAVAAGVCVGGDLAVSSLPVVAAGPGVCADDEGSLSGFSDRSYMPVKSPSKAVLYYWRFFSSGFHFDNGTPRNFLTSGR